MKKKYLVLILLISLVFVGASCNKKEIKKEIPIEEIIRKDAFIRDEARINIDEDEDKERVVLYVLNREIEGDTNIWCGNVSGEKMLGNFYLAVIDNNEIVSEIELLTEFLENGGDYEKTKIILNQDLNGDGRELEFVFDTYTSCSGSYIEIIGWDFEQKKLVRYKFYKGDKVSDELFISPKIGYGLMYRDEFLIQEYYSSVEPVGIFHSYYSFSKEKGGYNFIKTSKIAD